VPVVVTGADQPLGAAVVDALLAAGAGAAGGGVGGVEVRATVRDRSAVPGLVRRGVRTAVSDLVDPQRFGAVLEGAHTVIHLDAADPDGRGPGPVGTWDLLLDAAEDTGLRRVVTVCGPGTPVPEAGPYHLVVVRAAGYRPVPALVAALVEADRRRDGQGVEVIEVGAAGE
jgi:nucleoside-diphosphate-sugar epimerase